MTVEVRSVCTGGAVTEIESLAPSLAIQLPVWAHKCGLCALRARLLARAAPRHFCLCISRQAVSAFWSFMLVAEFAVTDTFLIGGQSKI